MNIIAAIEVASDAASRQDTSTTLADIKTLYGVYADVRAHGVNIPAMDKAGTLNVVVEAAARTTALLAALQNDPKTAPHVASLLASLS